MAKKKKSVSAVRLRPLLAAIKTRRAQPGRRMTQADYAVALDKVVRAIGRSRPGVTITVHSVQVL